MSFYQTLQQATACERERLFNAPIIEACRRVTGHPIPAEVAPRRAGDPATLIASSQRAKDELGWTPTRTDLDQIVADAWEYTQSR